MQVITANPTMTSREIADLIEKQHSHIKVSAERLAEKGVIGTLAPREFTQAARAGYIRRSEQLFSRTTSNGSVRPGWVAL